MKVRIVVIDPPGGGHGLIFAEMAELLAYGFQRLGHPALIARNEFDQSALNVVLAGFHLTPEMLERLPARTVFYNLEQVDDDLFNWAPSLQAIFSRFEIWDYSRRNVERLSRQAPVVRYLPVGTMPELTRINSAGTQDIDVLFYGSITERRRNALASIEQAGLKVHAVFGVYGQQRDAMIGRSKVVLNLHKHRAQVFEVVRVSYLLANRKAVVSEIGSATEIDPDLADAVRGTEFDGLAEACHQLVHDDAERSTLEERGFQRMRARNESYYLRKLLNQRQQLPRRRA